MDLSKNPTKSIEVRRSALHGMGVFTKRRIPAGATIIEYVGERISHDESAERYDESEMRNHHTFLFTVDDDEVIDGGVDGNESRFINHSCEPNCQAVQDGKRIWIEALVDIPKGSELTFDYQLESEGPLQKGWRKFYRCGCGTPSCRGTTLAAGQLEKRGEET